MCCVFYAAALVLILLKLAPKPVTAGIGSHHTNLIPTLTKSLRHQAGKPEASDTEGTVGPTVLVGVLQGSINYGH